MPRDKLLSNGRLILGNLNVLNASQPFTVFFYDIDKLGGNVISRLKLRDKQI
jgi:hypothetical protein